MSIISQSDAEVIINESAYEESDKIFNLFGLKQNCQANDNIGVEDQFYQNCHITHSDIQQNRGCHLTYSGDKASVKHQQQKLKQHLQQSLAAAFVETARTKKCSGSNEHEMEACKLASGLDLTPGSHNIQNIAKVTEDLTATIQDTLSGTCSSSTGGMSTVLCANSTLNNINIEQGRTTDTIASCIQRNVDKESISQRASAAISQTTDVSVNGIFQDLIYVGIISLGLGASYLIARWGKDDPVEFQPQVKGGADVPKKGMLNHWRLKIVAILLVWVVVIFAMKYVNDNNIGGTNLTNADITAKSSCQDCSKYKKESDCTGLGLCTWYPDPVELTQCTPLSPGVANAPISCLSPAAFAQEVVLAASTDGSCVCQVIYNKDNKPMGNCDNQCPNFRNKADCTNANCGWADNTPIFVDAPGSCVPLIHDIDEAVTTCGNYGKSDCKTTQAPGSNAKYKCNWVVPRKLTQQGGGYCTGDKTHCNPQTTLNFATNLAQSLYLV